MIYKVARLIQYIVLVGFLADVSGCSQRLLSDPQEAVTRLETDFTCENAPFNTPISRLDDHRIKNEVDRLAVPLIDNEENVGMVVAVSVAGAPPQSFSYGYRDLASHTPMSTDTVFALGSVTKSLVVSLLLVLNDKGLISLDDEIGHYLPADMELADPRVRKITFRQLASHTSGLPREPVEIHSLFKLIEYTFDGNNIYSHLDERYVLDYLQKVKLPDEPAKDAVYSNMGMGLLAYLMTQHMGKDLQTLLNKHLFSPLQMNNTSVMLTDTLRSRLATGYAGDQPYFMRRNTPLENWTFSPMMVGTGGAYSTASDLIRFLWAHLGYMPNGDIQTGNLHNGMMPASAGQNSIEEVLKPSRNILGRHNTQFLTMGWYVDQAEPYKMPLYYYHGMISGFNAYIGFEPSQKIAVVVLRNNFNWSDKVGHNLLVRLSLAMQGANHQCLSARLE